MAGDLIVFGRQSPIAQLAEHSTVNRRVSGSSPDGGASKLRGLGRRNFSTVWLLFFPALRLSSQ